MKKILGTRWLRRSTMVALAALALPGCSDGIDPEAELQLQMKTDLVRLAAAQEAHFTQTGSYTIDLTQLTLERTPGVSLAMQYVTGANGGGWGAEASHPESRYYCAMYEGANPNLAFISRWAGILEGEPLCKPIPAPAK